MRIYTSTFLILGICLLCQSAEGKEAAYVTVSDETGYTRIAVIDLNNRQNVKYIPIGPDALTGNFVLTPDGRSLLLAGYRANKIYQIDIETDTVIDSMSIFQPHRIAITPDSKYVISADLRTSKISFIDWSQKQIVNEIEGENSFASEILVTSDGRLAYLRGVDKITVVDVSKAQIINSILLEGLPRYAGLHNLAWNKRQGVLYVVNEEKRQISKIDSSSHQVVANIDLNPDGTLSHILLNSCEEQLYVSTTIVHQILDMETEQTIKRIPSIPSPPISQHMPRGVDIAFTPDGKYVYLTTAVLIWIDTGDPPVPGQVWVVSLEQGEVVEKLNIGLQPASIAMVVYPPPISGDFNADQRVEFGDFILFASAYGTTRTDEKWNCTYDLIWNGKIDFADFIQFVQLYNKE